MQGAFHEDLEVVPVLVQQLELEGIRDLIGRDPRLRDGLEAPDHEAAHLLLHVRVAVGIAQDRHHAIDARDLVGHDVEVLGRVQGHVDAGHRADCLGPLAGAVDDDLCLDVAAVGEHAGDCAVRHGHPENASALEDLDPAHAGALGKRLRDVGRIRRAVAREPDGALQVAGLQDGAPLQGLGGSEDLALEVEGIGRCGRAQQLHHALGRAGNGDPAALLVAGAQSGLGLELLVELRRVLDEPGAALRRAQLSHEPGRMPGGAGRELPLLEQHHIGPAEVGQVVGDAGADDAAADDDDAGAVRKCGHDQTL